MNQRLLFPSQMDMNVIIVATHEVTASGLARLFRPIPAGSFVGLGGAYNNAHELEYLAISTQRQAIIIRLKPRQEDYITKKTYDPVQLALNLKNILNDKLGTGATHKFLAFDAASIAVGLYLETGVHISGVVNLQTLVQSRRTKPSSFEAIFALFKAGGFTEADRDNLKYHFDDNCFVESADKRLVFRASSAMFMQNLHMKAIEASIESGTIINTSEVPTATLKLLASAARTGERLESLKPPVTNLDFQGAAVNEDGTEIQIVLDRYRSRPRANQDGQHVVIEHKGKRGKSKHTTATATHVDGRIATLTVSGSDGTPLQVGETIVSLTAVGREGPSSGQEQLRSLVMRGLQGNVNEIIESSPMIRLIWGSGSQALSEGSHLSMTRPSVGKHARSKSRPLPPYVTVPLNHSQARAVEEFCSGTPTVKCPTVKVCQGPPGSGKTTMIAAMVQWLSGATAGYRHGGGIYLVSQSNVAVKNIAEKLDSIGFRNYRLIVSWEYRHDWHDHLYNSIKGNVIDASQLGRKPQDARKLFGDARVILCTLSMLSQPRLAECGLMDDLVPPETLIVDEASQIEISGYITPFLELKTLKRACFVGDDKQLGPHGVDNIDGLQSIFEVEHLRDGAFFLDTQYRMPEPIGRFISNAVYSGKLKTKHPITSPGCVKFIDVPDGVESYIDTSSVNEKEIQAVVHCARQLGMQGKNYRILTGYDGQRNEIEKMLKVEGLPWEEAVFNIDSFQGNEADFIIISVVRTVRPGFLVENRRTNVMLSRCKVGMVIVANRSFLLDNEQARQTLIAKLAEELNSEWISWPEVEKGKQIFEPKDIERVVEIVETPRLTPISRVASSHGSSNRSLGRSPSASDKQSLKSQAQANGSEDAADTSINFSVLASMISNPTSSASTHCPWVSASQTNLPLTSSVTVTLDNGPARVVSAFCSSIASVSEPELMIVNGPPGSGKTSVAIGIIQWLEPSRSSQGLTYCYVVLTSEMAVRSFASRLSSVNYGDFKTIVSPEYFSNEWKDLDDQLKRKVVLSSKLPDSRRETQSLYGSIGVILCTMKMISEREQTDRLVPPEIIIFEDAENYRFSECLTVFESFRTTLTRACFIGDFANGLEASRGSLSSVKHLNRCCAFLSIQYRMPARLGNFISKALYDSRLGSKNSQNDTTVVRFVDVPDGEQVGDDGGFWNAKEVETVIQLARRFDQDWKSYHIVTAHEAQYRRIRDALKGARMPQDVVSTIDSFHGREEDYIIASVVHTSTSGYAEDPIRTKATLTRCRVGMVIVANRSFIMSDDYNQSLVRTMVQEWGNDWMDCSEVCTDAEIFLPEVGTVESISAHVCDPEVDQSTNSQEVTQRTFPEQSVEIFEKLAPSPSGKSSSQTEDRDPGPRYMRTNVEIKSQITRKTSKRYNPPSYSPEVPVIEIPMEYTTIMRHIWDPLSSTQGISPAASPFPTKQHNIPSFVSVPLDEQQREAAARFCRGYVTVSMPIVSVVLGGAGTGKTTMIVAMVQWLANNELGSEPSCCYLVSRSEPGIKNIAEALESFGFSDYRALVSNENLPNWREDLQSKIIEVGQVPQALQSLRAVFGSACVILCTLRTLIELAGSTLTTVLMPPGTIICDDAGQIPLSIFVQPFQKFGSTLSRVCFLGDDRQSSPYGEYSSRMATVFDVPHLRRNATVLRSQYRMSAQFGTFISCSLYNEVLEARRADVHASCVQFVDVPGVQVEDGISLTNATEVDAVLDCAKQFELQSKQYKIVTGYSAQRIRIEDGLKQAGLAWTDLVHTLDTIQGAEADYIIISLVQTRSPGFLNDPGSSTVISTRCRLGLVVVCNGIFLMEDPFAKTTLLASMAEAWGNDWMPYDTLKSGADLFPDDPSEPNYAQEIPEENYDELDASSETPGSETYFDNDNQGMTWPEDLQPTWN